MKEKIKQINDKYDVDVLIIIIISICGIVLNAKFYFYDELWTFYNIFRMSEGYTIYQDLNIIVTPLFFYIGKIILSVFGNNFLIFRIYSIAIYTSILYLVFKIFKNLDIPKNRSLFYVYMIIIILISIIQGGANYNTLVFVPVLYGILLIIKDKSNYIKQGMIIFFIFMCKQNFMVFYTLGIASYYFINNKNIIKTLKELIRTLLIYILPLILYLTYLYKTNNLYNFLNYCFLGMSEFSNNVLFNIITSKEIYISFGIIIFMLLLYNTKNKKIVLDNKFKKNILLFICVGGFAIFFAYPIANEYHSILSSIIIKIGFIYVLNNILIKELVPKNKITKTIFVLLTLSICMYSLINLVQYIYTINRANNYNYTILSFGNIYSEDDVNNIETMFNYIKENEKKGIKTVILSYEADAYFLNTDINYRNFNLPFLGNLGREGEKGLIKEIENLKNCNILIKTEEEDMFWQESKIVREYIQNNFEKIGIIEQFDIYFIK